MGSGLFLLMVAWSSKDYEFNNLGMRCLVPGINSTLLVIFFNCVQSRWEANWRALSNSITALTREGAVWRQAIPLLLLLSSSSSSFLVDSPRIVHNRCLCSQGALQHCCVHIRFVFWRDKS